MRHAILMAVASMIGLVSGTVADENRAFDEVVGHYEAIRLELIEDSTEGVAEHAEAIASAAAGLAGNFSPAAAGVDPENATTIESLLPGIEARALEIAAASDLEQTRSELAELTKPLVRWHELVEGPKPVVAYCSMVKRAWLQPDESIANPYAPHMLRCGEVVQR